MSRDDVDGRPLRSYFGEGKIDPLRSVIMSRVRSRDTSPERAVRAALWARGVRYRLYAADVPGCPDLVHRGAKVAVFIDGCFWHACPEHFRLPKTRTKFWREKMRRNVARRVAVRTQLVGWTILEYYECQISQTLHAVVDEIADSIRAGFARPHERGDGRGGC